MILSRKWSVFLVAVGVWTWAIWPRFAVAIWQDPRSFADGVPTSFLWVHAVLITVSLTVGTAVAVLGVRGWRAGRRVPRKPPWQERGKASRAVPGLRPEEDA